jgi:hypothetical protein
MMILIIWFEVSHSLNWIAKLKLNIDGSEDNITPVVSGRISTGVRDLDTLLQDGLPKGCSVILTSPSYDEPDMLIQRFLQFAVTNRMTVVYVCVDPSKILDISKQYPSNIRILACNPRPDVLPEDLPNLKTVNGLNLSAINIGLIQLLEKSIGKDPGNSEKIILLELVAEVLLQHKLLYT